MSSNLSVCSITLHNINYYYSRWLWFWIDRSLAKNIIVAWVIAVDSIKPWKRSFISTVRSTAFSCLTRNPWRRRSFEKTLFKPEEFETSLCVLVWKENILKTELSKPMSFLQTLTSLKYDRLKLRFQLTFSSVVWTENIWPVFRVKPFSFFRQLRAKLELLAVVPLKKKENK